MIFHKDLRTVRAKAAYIQLLKTDGFRNIPVTDERIVFDLIDVPCAHHLPCEYYGRTSDDIFTEVRAISTQFPFHVYSWSVMDTSAVISLARTIMSLCVLQEKLRKKYFSGIRINRFRREHRDLDASKTNGKKLKNRIDLARQHTLGFYIHPLGIQFRSADFALDQTLDSYRRFLSAAVTMGGKLERWAIYIDLARTKKEKQALVRLLEALIHLRVRRLDQKREGATGKRLTVGRKREQARLARKIHSAIKEHREDRDKGAARESARELNIPEESFVEYLDSLQRRGKDTLPPIRWAAKTAEMIIVPGSKQTGSSTMKYMYQRGNLRKT